MADRHCIELAGRIRKIFKAGIVLDETVRHYIASTRSESPEDALAGMLADPDDSENASLCELVFSPGEAIQVQLEGLLGRHRFRSADEDRVKAHLLSEPLNVSIIPDTDRAAVTCPMPPSCIRGFVSRLNITRQTGTGLADAIDKALDPPLATLAKVRLRHARCTLTDTDRRSRFLCRFIQALGPMGQGFFDRFAIMLELLDDIPDNADIHNRLTEEKRRHLKGLRASETFANRLKKSNMETLILARVHAPCVDTVEALRRIGWIDDICRAVFDRTEPLQPAPVCVSVDAGGNPRDAIRIAGDADRY